MNDYEDIEVPDALLRIAMQLKYLGNGDAGTTMGAIEAHGKFVSDAISTGVSDIAQAIRHGADVQAEALHQQAGEYNEIAGALDRIAEALQAIATAMTRMRSP
jgi:methyl-accepting chemotaxis protein